MDLTDVVMTPVRDLGSFIRDQREAAQISVRQLAKRAGVSNPYLSQVERGLRKPSAEMLAQIARGLQISVETLLAKAGILDAPAEADTAASSFAVIAAIRADPALTERQKTSMLDVYEAFRREPRQQPDRQVEPAPDQPDDRHDDKQEDQQEDQQEGENHVVRH